MCNKSPSRGLKALTSLISFSLNIYATVVICCFHLVVAKMFIKYSISCLILNAFVDMEALQIDSFHSSAVNLQQKEIVSCIMYHASTFYVNMRINVNLFKKGTVFLHFVIHLRSGSHLNIFIRILYFI